MSLTDQILDGIHILLRWWKLHLTVCHNLVALCRVTHTMFSNLIESKWHGLAGGIGGPDWSKLREPSEEQVCQQTSETVPCSRAELRWGSSRMGSDSLYQHTCLYKSPVLSFQGRAVLFVYFGKLSQYTGKSLCWRRVLYFPSRVGCSHSGGVLGVGYDCSWEKEEEHSCSLFVEAGDAPDGWEETCHLCPHLCAGLISVPALILAQEGPWGTLHGATGLWNWPHVKCFT